MSLAPYAKAFAAFFTPLFGWLATSITVVQTDTGAILQIPVGTELATAIGACLAIAGVVYQVPNKASA